jgi:hypothetical protein
MDRDKTRHLVGVWNPSYAADAMGATISLLLDNVRAFRAREIPEDDVYVWWGKVKSPNRQQKLEHLDDILAIDDALLSDDAADAHEVHLYLTDYRSLYVGHVGQIVRADDLAEEDERQRIPRFYRENNLKCDCWFQLLDIRRVVADDTLAVVEELKKLRNTRYNDRPVSIYGGMVELPLIVTRDDDARYFEPDVRERLVEGRYWVEFDAERTGIGEMERELRDNVVGEAAWNALDPAARTFVATAESLFRSHAKDPAFDFSSVVIDFAKALELQTNLIVRRALASAPPAERHANIDGRSVDLAGRDSWLSLGEAARVIGEDEDLNQAFKRRLQHGEWFTSSLPPTLREFAEVRNRAAHREAVQAAQVRVMRNRLLGVGMPSILVDLARAKPR